MDTNDTKSKEDLEKILEQIRKDKSALEGKFDEQYSYRDILEKDIVELMGFTSFDDQKKQDFRDKVGEMLERRVGIKILDSLSNETRGEYEKLIEEGKEDEAMEILNKVSIDPMEIMLLESIALKVELYLDSKVVRKQAQQNFDDKLKEEGIDASNS